MCNLNCVYLGILYFVCTHSGFPIISLVLFDFLCDVSIVYVAAPPFYMSEKLVYSSTRDHLQFDVTVYGNLYFHKSHLYSISTLALQHGTPAAQNNYLDPLL